MKKFLLLAVAGVASLCASAQVYVGGSVGAWRNGSAHETQISIMPEVGYTLSEKADIGTTIGWSYDHVTGVSTNVFQVNPYYRYNFYQTGKVKFFLQGGFGVGVGKTSYSEGDDSDTAVIWNIGITPGVSYAVSDRVTLLAKAGFLGYKGANDAAKDGGYADEWGFHFSSNDLSFGFVYNF